MFLVLLTILSVIGTALYSRYDISGAFYLFPARIFQFSAGAVIGCLGQQVMLKRTAVPSYTRDAIFVFGVIIIAVCVFKFNDKTFYPGWAALLPTIGAALIILAGQFRGGPGFWGRVTLCNPLIVWLGKLSYALYLVHWPIISLYRYETGLELTLFEQFGIGIFILVCAVGLHYGFERRFYLRNLDEKVGLKLAPGDFARRTGFVAFVVGGIAVHAWVTEGWAWRNPALILTAEDIKTGMRARYAHLADACRIDKFFTDNTNCNRLGNIRVLVLGNSHEPDGLNFIRGGYHDKQNIELVYFGTTNKCDSLRKTSEGDWLSSTASCQNRLDVFNNDSFMKLVDYIVYSANKPFDSNKNKFHDMIAGARTVNKNLRVITIGGYINTDVPCSRILNETGETTGCASPEHVVYFANSPNNQQLFNDFMSITDVFIDRVELLCEAHKLGFCLTSTPEGVPMFYDTHHLSLEFAKMSGQMYAERYPELFIGRN